MKRILFYSLFCLSCFSGEFYVSTNGTDGAAGTLIDPLSISKALGETSPAALGDTIWIRGGSYVGYVGASVAGEEGSPVTIRNYNRERAVIDGSFNSIGSWQTVWGLEIMNSNAVSRTNSSDVLGYGLTISGVGTKAVNLTIHDTGAPGIWWPTNAANSELYGCIMWGVGLYQTNGGMSGGKRGPIVYLQNLYGTKLVEDCIAFKSWTAGIKTYAESSYSEGVTFKNNVVFLNDLYGLEVITSNNPITNHISVGNVTFHDENVYGWTDAVTHNSLTLVSNYFIGDITGSYRTTLHIRGWTNVVMTNNVFAETSELRTGNPSMVDTMSFWQGYFTNEVQTLLVDYNSYFHGTEVYGHWYTNYSERLHFSDVQSAGLEAHGSYSANLPNENVALLRTNKYEQGRAYLTVLNFTDATSYTLDLSQVGLTNLQRFEIRDVQNFLGSPLVSGVYDSDSPSVSVSLVETAVTEIMGEQTHFTDDPDIHTSDKFNTFVILPLNALPPSQAGTARFNRIIGR